MTQETYNHQIKRLNNTLDYLTKGTIVKDDLPLFGHARNETLDIEAKLTALHLATFQNMKDTVEKRQEQIALSIEFARLVTFYGRFVSQDVTLWTNEINDDVEQQKYITLASHDDLTDMLTFEDKDQKVQQLTYQYSEQQNKLSQLYNNSLQGKTLFDATERTDDLTPDAARQAMIDTREAQKNAALSEVALLIDRNIFTLNHLYIIAAAEPDELEKMGLSDQQARLQEQERLFNLATLQNHDATTVLKSHAARHSYFEERLRKSKPQL